MILFPNAKINLGLNIVEKRNDGFHNLETCFVPIQWCDVLEFVEAKKTSFQSTGIPIPGAPDENLCLKAYDMLKKDFSLPDLQIHLHKNIPIGAGLGGGSSDAAFLLKGLAEKYNLIFEPELLKLYASQLGSDCTFFIDNSPSFAFEKGDVLEPAEINLNGKVVVVVYPEVHVDTKTAYDGVIAKKADYNLTDVLTRQPMKEWKNCVRNDFEPGIFEKFPAIKGIKEQFYQEGAIYASMSGSGSSVFGIFDKEVDLSFPENYSCWQGQL